MKDIIFITILIFLAFSINHKVYGNSNIQLSGYEVIKSVYNERVIKRKAKRIARYMHKRIKAYQELDWIDRYLLLDLQFKEIEKME